MSHLDNEASRSSPIRSTPLDECVTVGMATRLAGYIYNVSGFRETISYGTMALSLAGWLVCAKSLHLFASHILS